MTTTTTTTTPTNSDTSTSTSLVTKSSSNSSFITSLVGGGIAGMCVDISLYPIDTIKTRLQSPIGFWKSGGFTNIYNGLSITALGSAPGAALFFVTYETLKPIIYSYETTLYNNTNNSSQLQHQQNNGSVISHMIAASIGEAVACLVRVPTEVIKAKMQTSTTSNNGTATGSRKRTLFETIQLVRNEHFHQSTTNTKTNNNRLVIYFNNITGGLYRGYNITLLREIPFAMIQFPLYEQFKLSVLHYNQQQQQLINSSTNNNNDDCTIITSISPIQAAACGSISGAIAAAITTPLDVIKTRLMIGIDQYNVPYKNAYDVYIRTVQEQGGHITLLKGIQPRVFWITLGGFVFFGSYEQSKQLVQYIL